MLTQPATTKQLAAWKTVWQAYRGRLQPNRKPGAALLRYLRETYVLTPVRAKEAANAVADNVTMNPPFAEKLPAGVAPAPKTFFVENAGNGAKFYQKENRDDPALWGGKAERIFVGLDTVTGFFMVEGSTLLWDELYAFRGLDARDLQNPYCVAEYIACLRRFGMLGQVTGSAE